MESLVSVGATEAERMREKHFEQEQLILLLTQHIDPRISDNRNMIKLCLNAYLSNVPFFFFLFLNAPSAHRTGGLTVTKHELMAKHIRLH